MTDQPVPVSGTTCPICQQTWQALNLTYQTWLEHAYDPLYSEAHTMAVQAYLRHRLTGHMRPHAGKEERACSHST